MFGIPHPTFSGASMEEIIFLYLCSLLPSIGLHSSRSRLCAFVINMMSVERIGRFEFGDLRGKKGIFWVVRGGLTGDKVTRVDQTG